MRLKIERLTQIVRSRNIFASYVDGFYQGDIFAGPSVFFHRRVIQMIRDSGNYNKLLTNELFLERIYATLVSWGMHRMGPRGAKMRDFESIRQSIDSNRMHLEALATFKLHELDDAGKEHVKDRLLRVFDNLRVMKSRSQLVGSSKTLHHLLPDLVPPIDREYTVRFFYGTPRSKPSIGPEGEAEVFLEIFDGFHHVCRNLGLTEADYLDGRYFNTSIPKLIDNAIVGFVLTEWKAKRQPRSG